MTSGSQYRGHPPMAMPAQFGYNQHPMFYGYPSHNMYPGYVSPSKSIIVYSLDVQLVHATIYSLISCSVQKLL